MATFLAVLKYVLPFMAGTAIGELWRQNRALKRLAAGYQRVVTKFTVPGGVIEMPGTMTAEEAEEFKRRWRVAVGAREAHWCCLDRACSFTSGSLSEMLDHHKREHVEGKR
jgi:hypothetical protein